MLEEEYEKRRVLPPHLRKRPEAERPFSFEIRPAQERDIPDIREIYNYYVTNSVVTFDESTWSLAQWREKLAHLQKLDMPFLVAESPSGQILGYACASPWKQKAAYRYTVENSIYLGPASTGKGLGKALMAEFLARAKEAGIKEVIAVIADKGAEASIAMHRNFGFKEIGHMGKVGHKFGRWLGTYLLQKSLK